MKIIVAIDGYSSCGKSTLAKALAQQLSYAFIDTGAMYRAVTLYCLRQNIDYKDLEVVQLALKNITIHFESIEGKNTTFLNGENVEHAIRQMEVSNLVSEIAAISIVRKAMVAQQRQMGAKGGVIMDGRDIGTVVFPNAQLKIFVTADPEVRARRRFSELQNKGEKVTLEAVKANLSHRDHIDTTRADSPLKQAENAKLLDNTHLTRAEQLQLALNWVEDILAN